MIQEAHAEAQKILPAPRMLIGGEWVGGSRGAVLEHVDPSTGRPLPPFARAEREDVDAAVKAGRAVFPAWRNLAVDKRRTILLDIARNLRARQNELATIAALESGSPIGRGVIARAADQFEYYAGWVDKFGGEVIKTYPRRGLNYVKYEPLGIIAALITYNGPIVNAAMKLGPALAMGNVMIVRPPEMGPFGMLRMAEIMIEAGLPAGVVSVVTGGPDAADALARHPDIDKISLTGGVVTARKVIQAASDHIKPLVMELGGKSANIVFEDANLDDPGFAQTVLMVIGSSGQGCLYGTRLLVHDSIHDRVVAKVLELSKLPRMGDPLDPSTGIGPVISERASERILGYVDEARADGKARVILGGARAGGELSQGWFVEPTVLVDVDNRSRIAQEEVFGPVLGITRFGSEEEAVALANDTSYGLHAYLHTRDVQRAHRVADDLVAGGVSINSPPPMTPNMPFGGVKQSGFGREGSRAAIEEFVQHKNIYLPLD